MKPHILKVGVMVIAGSMIVTAKILTLATSKGGTGKSTLTRSIAAYWSLLGFKVLIIDADPQGSIITRHDPEGPLKTVTVIAEPEETINNLIEESQSNFDYIIVDTGGFKNRTTIKALLNTDLALIPLKPSADDISGAIETQHLVKEINKTPERSDQPIQCKLILTMTQNGTVISKHVRKELEEQGYPLLKSEMFQRVAYPESAINGLSPCVVDPEGAAARDIVRIINELEF